MPVETKVIQENIYKHQLYGEFLKDKTNKKR
jgi:hypothetical protein